jgi:hypothetical protein
MAFDVTGRPQEQHPGEELDIAIDRLVTDIAGYQLRQRVVVAVTCSGQLGPLDEDRSIGQDWITPLWSKCRWQLAASAADRLLRAGR